jgi:NAD(P)-dependent dehydrogenase (short-subunit alcohol dehydrogenase family)
MLLEGKTVMVTGANRGIGKALVAALLEQKVKKIYAAARKVSDLEACSDKRVVAIAIDITNRSQIGKASQLAADVQVLINNAGALSPAGVVSGDATQLMRDMEVNYFGTLSMVQGFAPVIAGNGGGAVANVISVVGLAAMAGIGGYSASKAALLSATQSMRSELKGKNIDVFGIFPGPIDTDMARDFPIAKASPESTARAIVAQMMEGKEDIFPDPMSQQAGQLWLRDPKALERQFY